MEITGVWGFLERKYTPLLFYKVVGTPSISTLGAFTLCIHTYRNEVYFSSISSQQFIQQFLSWIPEFATHQILPARTNRFASAKADKANEVAASLICAKKLLKFLILEHIFIKSLLRTKLICLSISEL